MIPLARPWIDEAELEAAAAVLRSGMLVQGAVVARFEEALAARCGRRFAVAVSNGTSALALVYRALGLRAGDAIAVPALTWPSPAHAALELGLDVRLADVDARTWNATSESLRAAGDVKLAVAIDQFGNPLDTIALDVPVVEDAACAIGSVLASGRPCGSVGIASCLSFHPRKLVTTGEGGAVLTDDPELAQTLRVLRNHGQSAPGVFETGSGNYRLSELAAAVGIAQLDKLDAMIVRRREHAEAIRAGLPELRFQRVVDGARGNEQTLGAVLPDDVDRERFFVGMRAREVQAGILSYDLTAIGTSSGSSADFASRPAGRRAAHEVSEGSWEGAPRGFTPGGGGAGDSPSRKLVGIAPNASAIVARGIALPLFPQMTVAERERVIEAARAAIEEATDASRSERAAKHETGAER
jgi:perosamine synthetase